MATSNCAILLKCNDFTASHSISVPLLCCKLHAPRREPTYPCATAAAGAAGAGPPAARGTLGVPCYTWAVPGTVLAPTPASPDPNQTRTPPDTNPCTFAHGAEETAHGVSLSSRISAWQEEAPRKD